MSMQTMRHASGLAASTSAPQAPCCWLPRRIQRRRASLHGPVASSTVTQAPNAPEATAQQQQQQQQLGRGIRRPQQQRTYRNAEDLLPVYVALESDVVSPLNTLGYEEALRVGLTALRLLGVRGISVDVMWGVVERNAPQEYTWSGYKQLFNLISEMGFKIKVNLCFNSMEGMPLPEWVLKIGNSHPDIWYTDKGGQRSMECVSLGIDDAVPGILGRTPVHVYRDLMQSFKDEFAPMLGTHITEVLIGLGPRGELRYPSHPQDSRWEYPGVGEFQCYDRYMLSSLKACAEQVKQPPWGLGGPHDAGNYKSWPHQSGFFSHTGNWSSPYGKFFLQWYSEMLLLHAQRVMSAAGSVFAHTGVTLNTRIPALHWWYSTVSHGAELTAGYYNTSGREGYLPVFRVLAQQHAGVHLGMAEAKTSERPPGHCSDPERLLLQQRTVAAALHIPVTLENTEVRFDDAALAKIHSSLFDPAIYLGIEVPPVRALVFNRMSDVMFETSNWQRFKGFVRKVRTHAEDNAALYASGEY